MRTFAAVTICVVVIAALLSLAVIEHRMGNIESLLVEIRNNQPYPGPEAQNREP